MVQYCARLKVLYTPVPPFYAKNRELNPPAWELTNLLSYIK